MALGHISKAVAGSLAGAIGSVGTTYVVVPDGVAMPWWGYVAVGAINAALGFLVVYQAPRNRS